jgi:hypothetical protein
VTSARKKRTTIRVGPGVTAETVAAALLDFEWWGGPYRLELTGRMGCPQVWARDKAEADRVMSHLLDVCGVDPEAVSAAVRTEGVSNSSRFATVRKFRLHVRDGLAIVSDRQGPDGGAEYPVVGFVS